jgi:hypothetical protein
MIELNEFKPLIGMLVAIFSIPFYYKYYGSYNTVHPFMINSFKSINAFKLGIPFPLISRLPLTIALDDKLEDKSEDILSIKVVVKLQVFIDKFETPTGIDGKSKTKVLSIIKETNDEGKDDAENANNGLLSKDILTIVSGNVEGVDCKKPLLPAKRVVNPNDKGFGNEVKKLLEQSIYDNVKGKLIDDKKLLEQSIYDIDTGKLGNEISKLLSQVKLLSDDDEKL